MIAKLSFFSVKTIFFIDINFVFMLILYIFAPKILNI